MADTTLAAHISRITSPYLSVPFFILLAGLAYVQDLLELVLYGAVAVGFTVVIPLLYTLSLVRRGKVDDIHIYDRGARLRPLAVTTVSSIVGFLVLHLIGASEDLIGLAILLFLMAAVTLAATSVFKISGHVSAWAGGCTVVAILHGPYALPLFLVGIPIGWSRLALERHRPIEVVIGFVYGIASASVLALLIGVW
ncbi:MAG: hypothetical protein JSW25_00760 [Thermoplasmata archaeon]|nr:MAG: hypothetical protein JSW25_00760 [Thermoplasmata archaeon]